MAGTFTADDVKRTFKERDAWWTVLLVDPVAAPVVRVLANRTSVTPNQLSFLAFVLGMGSATMFLFGTWPWLVGGAALFYLAFYVDCLDGKIARLKGTGSTWGQWLDFIFDRVRIFIGVFALVLGQYLQTGNAWFFAIGMCAVFIECLRYINAAHTAKVRQWMRTQVSAALKGTQPEEDTDEPPFIEDVLADNPELDPDEVAAQGEVVDLHQGFRSKFTVYSKVRLTLQRRRIRPHLWSGIEFQMFTCIVGPLTNQVAPVMIGSAVLLVVFELVIVYKLWLDVRDFDRTMAKIAEEQASADQHDDRNGADSPPALA